VDAQRDEPSEDVRVRSEETSDLFALVNLLDRDGFGDLELLNNGESGLTWEDGMVDEVVIPVGLILGFSDEGEMGFGDFEKSGSGIGREGRSRGSGREWDGEEGSSEGNGESVGFASEVLGESKADEGCAVGGSRSVVEGAVVLAERLEVLGFDLQGYTGVFFRIYAALKAPREKLLTLMTETQFLSMMPFPKNSLTSSPNAANINAAWAASLAIIPSPLAGPFFLSFPLPSSMTFSTNISCA
jgi:hypothetical protein